MQKRRGGGSGSGGSDGDGLLPMTVADTTGTATTRKRRRRRTTDRRGRSAFLCNSTTAGVAIIMVMLTLSVFVMKRLLDPKDVIGDINIADGSGSLMQKSLLQRKAVSNGNGLPTIAAGGGKAGVGEGLLDFPLSKFSSLTYALENADIVALYFAASWCPMSTPITKALDAAFSNKDILLPPPSNPHDGAIQHNKRHRLAIVYVSSDGSEEDMMTYAKPEWNVVPYDSPERNDLKRHFSTCARKEMKALGIDPRKHEIPTLIIVDSSTHGILSSNGVEDMKKATSLGEDGPLYSWQEMQSLARAMEDNFM